MLNIHDFNEPDDKGCKVLVADLLRLKILLKQDNSENDLFLLANFLIVFEKFSTLDIVELELRNNLSNMLLVFVVAACFKGLNIKLKIQP